MVSVKKVECAAMSLIVYRKIPKISPGAYIFQGAFLRGLFLEGLIFGVAYIRRGLSSEGNLRFKIDWASLIVGSKFTIFALFYFVFETLFQVQPPRGAYICVTGLGGLYLEGLIHRGAYFGILRYYINLICCFPACCDSCNRCCCICLSRVPCASLIASFILAIGFTGFALGLSEGVKNLNIFLKMDIV